MLTRTNPDVPKHKGLTMFIVPLKAEGVEVQPVYTFQDERTNITYYDGVRVPDAYRLGEVGGGAMVMAAQLEIEHGSSFKRSQIRMLKAAERYCRRVSRGGRPLIEDPRVLARLARCAANIARHLGLLPGEPEIPAEPQVWLDKATQHEVLAPADGLWVQSSVKLCDVVDEGQLLGHVLAEESLETVPLTAPVAGRLSVLGCPRENCDVSLAAQHPYVTAGEIVAKVVGLER
jgi:hypothetical protein